jgi:hypothetical protein
MPRKKKMNVDIVPDPHASPTVHAEWLMVAPYDDRSCAIPPDGQSSHLASDITLYNPLDTGRWATFGDSYGLSLDQLAFLVAGKVFGRPQRDIAEMFGWAPAKGERIRKSLDRKLPKIQEAMKQADQSSAPITPLPAIPLTGKRVVRLWYLAPLVSHSQLSICPQNTLSRSTSSLIRTTITMFTIEVSTKDVEAEIRLLAPPYGPRLHSLEYIEDLARDIVRNRMVAERESAERARIGALSDTDLEAELAACEAHLPSLNGRIDEAFNKLKKLRARNFGGIEEAADALFRLKTNWREVLWLITTLKDQVSYRQRVALQRDVLKAESQVEGEVRDSLRKLATRIYTAHPLLANGGTMFASATDPAERAMLLAVTRALAQLATFRKGKEAAAEESRIVPANVGKSSVKPLP